MLKSTPGTIFMFLNSQQKKNSYWNSESLFYYTGKIILNYVAPVFTKVPNQYQKN